MSSLILIEVYICITVLSEMNIIINVEDILTLCTYMDAVLMNPYM